MPLSTCTNSTPSPIWATPGDVTVALLWNAGQRRIVSNESSHIPRGLDAARTAHGHNWTLRPDRLADEIDALSDCLQRELSHAVYQAGKARRQDAYDGAVGEVFAMLNGLDARLARMPSTGERADRDGCPPMADPRAVRRGPSWAPRVHPPPAGGLRAPVGLRARCSKPPRRGGDVRRSAIHLAHYGKDRDLSPFGIVASAPLVDWQAPHGRERLGPRSLPCATGRQCDGARSWDRPVQKPRPSGMTAKLPAHHDLVGRGRAVRCGDHSQPE